MDKPRTDSTRIPWNKGKLVGQKAPTKISVLTPTEN
jgi:hypothetical protein